MTIFDFVPYPTLSKEDIDRIMQKRKKNEKISS